MSRFKRFTAGLFMCVFLVSSVVDAKYAGPIAIVGVGTLGLGAAIATALFAVPPNQLHPGSYAPTTWTVTGYDAEKKDCFQGCFDRGNMFTDQRFCFWAPYTASVQGSYNAFVDGANVTESAQRFSICGDNWDNAISGAQTAHPEGSTDQVWYNINKPTEITDGSTNYLLVGLSVSIALLSLFVVGVGVSCVLKVKNQAHTYTPLADVIAK